MDKTILDQNRANVLSVLATVKRANTHIKLSFVGNYLKYTISSMSQCVVISRTTPHWSVGVRVDQ